MDAQTLRTIVAHIHALGDCIGIDGQPMRHIEPIGRQILRIAASSTGDTPAPYDRRAPPIRIKTGSRPITVGAARETDRSRRLMRWLTGRARQRSRR